MLDPVCLIPHPSHLHSHHQLVQCLTTRAHWSLLRTSQSPNHRVRKPTASTPVAILDVMAWLVSKIYCIYVIMQRQIVVWMSLVWFLHSPFSVCATGGCTINTLRSHTAYQSSVDCHTKTAQGSSELPCQAGERAVVTSVLHVLTYHNLPLSDLTQCRYRVLGRLCVWRRANQVNGRIGQRIHLRRTIPLCCRR
jgi:hypothetical protein